MNELKQKQAVVVGASRGFGRAIAEALAAAGAEVTAVARSMNLAGEPANAGALRWITADATDGALAVRLLREVRPEVVVLNAGASPSLAPLQEQTWESFSVNWNSDVKIGFHWIQAALRQPLAAGSAVIALSSGAALGGSPLSGGYAGAKATVRFLAQYGAAESKREQLGIRFHALLPNLTPETELGRAAALAYAARAGRSLHEWLGSAPRIRSADVGAAVARLATDPSLSPHVAFRLEAGALSPLS